LKCPICGVTLLHNSSGSYKCSNCQFEGKRNEILELKRNLQKIDAILDMKQAEIEYWHETRRLAIQGVRQYVRNAFSANHSNPSQASTTTTVQKRSIKMKLGQMLASIEIGTSSGWFVYNSYALATGTLSSAYALIPFIFLIQGIVLFIVSCE